MKQVFVLIAFFAAASYLMMNSDRTTLGNKITQNIENLRSSDAYASTVVGMDSYIKIDNKKNLIADIDNIKTLYLVQQNKNNTNKRMTEGNVKVFNSIIRELTSIIDECPRSITSLRSKLSVDESNKINIADMQAILTSSYSSCT